MTRQTSLKTNSLDTRGIIIGGGIAGIIAGVVMAVAAMAFAGMMGLGFLAPLRMIAAALYGVDALIGGAEVLIAGLIIHMIVSAGFGIVFAALLSPRASGGAAFGWGLLYSVVVLGIMTAGVLPWSNPTMAVRVPLMAGAWFFEHLVYGAVLAITPGWVRSFSVQRPLAEVTPYPERRAA